MQIDLGTALIGLGLIALFIFTRDNVANCILGLALITYFIYLILQPGIDTYLQDALIIAALGIGIIATIRMLNRS